MGGACTLLLNVGTFLGTLWYARARLATIGATRINHWFFYTFTGRV